MTGLLKNRLRWDAMTSSILQGGVFLKNIFDHLDLGGIHQVGGEV